MREEHGQSLTDSSVTEEDDKGENGDEEGERDDQIMEDHVEEESKNVIFQKQ